MKKKISPIFIGIIVLALLYIYFGFYDYILGILLTLSENTEGVMGVIWGKLLGLLYVMPLLIPLLIVGFALLLFRRFLKNRPTNFSDSSTSVKKTFHPIFLMLVGSGLVCLGLYSYLYLTSLLVDDFGIMVFIVGLFFIVVGLVRFFTSWSK